MQLPAIGVGGITYDSGTRTLSVIGTAIINTGGEPITGSGLCHYTTSPPTINNIPHANSGNTTPFTTNITFPTPTGVETYYIRAYVNNAGGIAYSTQTITLTIDNAGVATSGPAFI